jgi:hypothetical protein
MPSILQVSGSERRNELRAIPSKLVRHLSNTRTENRLVRHILPFAVLLGAIVLIANSANAEDETAGHRSTKEKLKQKITLELDNVMLREIIDELRGAVKGGTAMRIKPDPKDGITLTSRFTIKAKDETLESVLDKLLKEKNWGYYIQNGPAGSQDDGAIVLVAKPWRGSPNDDTKTKKDDPKKKEVVKDDPKKEATSDDEKAAAGRMNLAEFHIERKNFDKAKPILEDVVKKYPNTKAAAKAKELLEKIKK